MAPEAASTRADWIPLLPLRSPMRRTSGTSSLQSESRWSFRMPIVPSLFLSRKTSDASSFRSAISSPRLAPSTYSICKIPRLDALAPLSNPLRIFKRQNRKTSLRAVLSNPSVESLEARASLYTVAEALVTETETLSEAFDYHVTHKDSVTGGNSSVSLLLSLPPPRTDDEGYSTERCPTPILEKQNNQATETKDRIHATSHRHDINLKRPTPIQKIHHPKHSLPVTRCALCKTALRLKSETYTFPQTAPAVIQAVRTLYPTIDDTNPYAAPPRPPNPRHLKRKHSPPPHQPLSPNPYVPPPSPPFCASCFTTLRTHHLCWTCGHPIHRPEERIACGWAWWHWSCLSCLLCRAPLRPPAWTGEEGGMRLGGSPVCGGCGREVGEMVGKEGSKRRMIGRGRRVRMGVGVGLDGEVAVGGGSGDDDEEVEEEEEEEEEVYRAEVRVVGCATLTGGGGGGGVSTCGGGSTDITSTAAVAATAATKCSGGWSAIGHVDYLGWPSNRKNDKNPKNDRMKWLTMRGGGVGCDGHGHGGGSVSGRINTLEAQIPKRNISGNSGKRLKLSGEMQYPPLPKWMEGLPGRRKGRMRSGSSGLGGGGRRDVSVGSSRGSGMWNMRPEMGRGRGVQV